MDAITSRPLRGGDVLATPRHHGAEQRAKTLGPQLRAGLARPGYMGRLAARFPAAALDAGHDDVILPAIK